MRVRFLICALLSVAMTHAAAAEPRCRVDPRFDIASTQARVIVLGEGTHGTKEAPAFVAGVLCAYVETNKPVLLAWEHPRDKQDALNDFMDSGGAPADRNRLVAAVLRSGSGQDSLAILEMLDTARRLRQRGAQIAISLVDSAESDILDPLYKGEDKYAMYSQSQRQRLMASVVETRATQYPDHAIIFFTSQASRTVGDLGRGYESATLLLSRRVPVYVIGFAYDGGQAWRCQGKTLPEAICKEYDVRPTKGYADADQAINFGMVTASPPSSPNPDPIYVPPPVPKT